MKLLIIGQQKLHVGLQQEADLLLRSPLALFLFFFMLFLLAEDGVEVLSDRQAHHQVCNMDNDQRRYTNVRLVLLVSLPITACLYASLKRFK